ncbi:Rac GTPase-activating protein 1 [Cichlidogyrus casuarinus]|uniref:Rac GTPase-activating protein 1 n=1 Tax=Cichlidogyrus casuarinus TaxID=1844966 RepID=A0ABD2QJY2_9PLAT
MHSKLANKRIAQAESLVKPHTTVSNRTKQLLNLLLSGERTKITVLKHISERYRNLSNYYIASKRAIIRLKLDHDNLVKLVDKEAHLRSVVEAQRDDLETKLKVIKDILRNKEHKYDKDYIHELESCLDLRKSLNLMHQGSLIELPNSDIEDGEIEKILPPTRLSRHSAGSLLDPENLSDNFDVPSLLVDSQKTRNSSINKSKTSTSFREETRRSVLSSKPSVFIAPPLNEDYFDIDFDQCVEMPPMLTNKPKIHFDKNIDTYSVSSQNTLSDATSIGSVSSTSRFNRKHAFQLKTSHKNETCHQCGCKIPFGKSAVKCANCRIAVHPSCQRCVTQQCLSMMQLPGSSIDQNSVSRGNQGSWNQAVSLSQFCPIDETPSIPAIVILCANEVALRGLDQLGIYRLSGSDKQTKELYEKFMRSKIAPSLGLVTDINVICGCLKLFLRKLDDPLITR